jgi:hypothetical protein
MKGKSCDPTSIIGCACLAMAVGRKDEAQPDRLRPGGSANARVEGLEGRPNAKMLAQVRATEGRYKRRSGKR